MRSLMESRVDAHAPPASPSASRFDWPSLPTCRPSLRSSRSRRWFDSITSLRALATFPAVPVQVAGRRAEKSPRLTAFTTPSITRGSISLLATTLGAMCWDSSPLVRPFGSRAGLSDSLVQWNPEFHAGPCAWLTLDAASTTGQLRTFTHRNEPKVAGYVHRLGDDKPFAVVAHDDADAAVSRVGSHLDPGGEGMFFRVRQRLRYILEYRRLDCRRQ